MKVFTHSATINAAGTTYSDVMDISKMENVTAVQMILTPTRIQAAGALDVTLQYSHDRVNWVDGTAFTQVNAASSLSPSISPSISSSISPSLSPSISSSVSPSISSSISSSPSASVSPSVSPSISPSVSPSPSV